MEEIKKPNLFLVGCGKSGTTSLYVWLKQHPQIFMSEIKGPDFFSEVPNRDNPVYWKNESKYLSLFKDAKSNQKVIGEASHYFHQKGVPEKMRKFNPNSKIIILLRNPFEVIRSYYDGGAIPKGIDIREGSSSENREVRELLSSLKYSENVKRWVSAFGKQNVHIIITEELKKDPLKEWKELTKFLGVGPSFVPDFTIENQSRETKNRWVGFIIVHLAPRFKLFTKKILGKNTANRVRHFLINLMTKKIIKESIDKNIKQSFEKQVKEEKIKTERILGRKLDVWNI